MSTKQPSYKEVAQKANLTVGEVIQAERSALKKLSQRLQLPPVLVKQLLRDTRKISEQK